MRTSTLGATVACTGLGMMAWALFAMFKGVAQSTGGSYGPQPVGDFVAEHFMSWGALVLVTGLIVWFVGLLRSRMPTAQPAETPQATSEELDRLRAAALPVHTEKREFHGVDQFGWPHTVVAVQEYFARESEDGAQTVAGPLSVHALGGGGLVRIQAGVYEDPASRARIRCDDPSAP